MRAPLSAVRASACFLTTILACTTADAAVPARIQKLSGCYDFALTSGHAAGETVHRSLRRRVEFFAELTTTKLDDAGDNYAVRENRSSGFGRLFKNARWSAQDDHSFVVIFSDGAEEWSATMKAANKSLLGTATYSGDAGQPDPHWSATASHYTCKQ